MNAMLCSWPQPLSYLLVDVTSSRAKLDCKEESTREWNGKRIDSGKGAVWVKEGQGKYGSNDWKTVQRQDENELWWTAVISRHTSCGQHKEALRMYEGMRQHGVKASTYTFLAALKACRSLGDLEAGKRIHAHAIQTGNESHMFVATMLLDMYMKCGSMMDAHRLFHKLPCRDVVSWTAIILGCANRGESEVGLHLYAQMQQEGVAPNDRTFVAALKACAGLAAMEEGLEGQAIACKPGSVEKGRAIHSRVVQCGLEADLFLGNTLIDMYARCGSMVDAQHVFHRLPRLDVVSCNAMILGYVENHEGELALQLYAQMQQAGVAPDDRTFLGALKACGSLAALEEGEEVDGKIIKAGCLEKGRAIHSRVVKAGFELDVFVGTTLVDMYAKCGSLVDAQHIFDKLPRRDAVSWTAMISRSAHMDEGGLALELYAKMQKEGLEPCCQTFAGILKACSSLAALEEVTDGRFVKQVCLGKGRSIHSRIVEASFESNLFVGNMLVNMYAKCGSMVDAQHVFDKLPHRNVVSWTCMILGYAQTEEGHLALELYAQMQQEGVMPNERTFVGALKACSSLATREVGTDVYGNFFKLGCLEKVRDIHCQLVKTGYVSNVFTGNTLIDMYSKCRSMWDAWYVFHKLPHLDVVSWNAMIMGYAQKEEGELAFQFYVWMQQEGVEPDDQTFVGVFKACRSLVPLEEETRVGSKWVKIGCLKKARAIHCQVVKAGFETNTYIAAMLVDIYARCGSMLDARHVFDMLPHCYVDAWNVMILGYSEQAESEHAFKLYAQMQEEGVPANCWTFVSILKACGNVVALETGKEMHAQIRRFGVETTNRVVGNALIDMYAKCGSMVDAQHVFDALPMRSIVTWSALIAGYARQGESELVFRLFRRMMEEGIQPNRVTFLSVLTLCSHVGLVDKGMEYFNAMSKDHGISPSMEHFSCMVDLLGRAGQSHDAVAMLHNMPFHPDLVIWRTLLSACWKWGDVEVGIHAFEHALRLNKCDAPTYVLMSNIYADAHMWEEHNRIQAMRENAQAWKEPGQSWWVEMGRKVHKFVAGDMAHPKHKDIYAKLKDLSTKI